MQPAEKVARHRMSVLELAQSLGNVTEACRQRQMTRTQFYDYKRRFELQGLEGLKDLPPIHKTHPQTTAPAVVDQILALSLEHPAWGCVRLSAWLKRLGVRVSSPTIQTILIKHGMGTKFERLLKLETQVAHDPVALSPEQLTALEDQNPALKERHVESSRPGELLCQDTFLVGAFKGIGKVYLHSVIDTYGSYAFGFLHPGKVPEAAAAVLHNDVLPFYRERGITVGAILTDNGREFCGTNTHPFELYLALNDIDHRRTRVAHPYTNGFVERFHRTVKDEFFAVALRETFYEAVEPLQLDLDQWLIHYNTERPHLGYRNQGKTPLEFVSWALATATIEA